MVWQMMRKLYGHERDKWYGSYMTRSLAKIWLARGQECGKMEWQYVARSVANVMAAVAKNVTNDKARM
jgi:hypothetical protein